MSIESYLEQGMSYVDTVEGLRQQYYVFETIFRFKGQQAPAVILVDLDKTIKRDDWATGLLYCAMTRATVRLELVVQKECPWIETFRENLDQE